MLRPIVVALALLVTGATVHAQGYPTRPIKLIVADAAGGAPDQLARLVAEKVSTGLGQPVVVDNRAGASGAVGAEFVAKSPPDGYTLLMTTSAIYALLPALRKDLPYDPVKDFVPIQRIATASNVLVVNNALPVNDIAGLGENQRLLQLFIGVGRSGGDPDRLCRCRTGRESRDEGKRRRVAKAMESHRSLPCLGGSCGKT